MANSMKLVCRNFENLHILKELAQASGWWQDLLRAWAPAGSSATPDRFLRIGIRNNEIHLYHLGQRIACVWIGHDQTRRDVPKLKVHQKYAFNGADGSDYAILIGNRLSCRNSRTNPEYLPGTSLAKWTERSRNIRGKQVEKRLLEGFVARNPEVVDLEMGVPAWDEQVEDAIAAGMSRRARPFAPRMDLVLLEKAADGAPHVVFWEGKTANDVRLRANEDAKAVKQLRLYRRYLSRENYRAGVGRAYHEACRILVQLHCMAKEASGSELP
ncbi:MAG: hypothetical protein ACTHLK_07030, partial [Brucella intermedia]